MGKQKQKTEEDASFISPKDRLLNVFLCKSEPPSARRRAVVQLGQLKDPSIVNVLKDDCRFETSWRVLRAVVDTIKNSGGPDALPALQAIGRSPSYRSVWTAAQYAAADLRAKESNPTKTEPTQHSMA